MILEILRNLAALYVAGAVVTGAWIYAVLGDQIITDKDGMPIKYAKTIAVIFWPYSLYQLMKGDDA